MSGPPCVPPSGATGCPCFEANPTAPSDPPSHHSPPVLSPSSPPFLLLLVLPLLPVSPQHRPPVPLWVCSLAPHPSLMEVIDTHTHTMLIQLNWTTMSLQVHALSNHGCLLAPRLAALHFKTFVCSRDTHMGAIAAQCLGTETMSLKSFLWFPQVDKISYQSQHF